MEAFNLDCPVGTRVRYWRGVSPGKGREGDGKEGLTRSTAFLQGGRVARVFVAGCPVSIPLDQVEVIEQVAGGGWRVEGEAAHA